MNAEAEQDTRLTVDPGQPVHVAFGVQRVFDGESCPKHEVQKHAAPACVLSFLTLDRT